MNDFNLTIFSALKNTIKSVKQFLFEVPLMGTNNSN